MYDKSPFSIDLTVNKPHNAFAIPRQNDYMLWLYLCFQYSSKQWCDIDRLDC